MLHSPPISHRYPLLPEGKRCDRKDLSMTLLVLNQLILLGCVVALLYVLWSPPIVNQAVVRAFSFVKSWYQFVTDLSPDGRVPFLVRIGFPFLPECHPAKMRYKFRRMSTTVETLSVENVAADVEVL